MFSLPFSFSRRSFFPLLPLVFSLVLFGSFNTEERIRRQFLYSCLISIFAYFSSIRLIPHFQHYSIKAGLAGRDLNKIGPKEEKPLIPESLGAVTGVIYIICIILSEYLFFLTESDRSQLSEFNAALHSIGFMLFLGFADDVVDLPWRYKLILPAIASLPLLTAYGGATAIVVPKLARPFLGNFLELGAFYRIYMGLVAVFCTNAINIHAGINGLEAGQSFVIGCAVLIHNILELNSSSSNSHLFSLILILPFLASTLGLLNYNWFPSKVFVGDTFTNFAGMTLAVTGILGHFSKTLLLFFIPQIINFLYSLPQILGLFGLKCPRHRLPKLNSDTGKLEGIPTHHNLLNLVLCLLGPMKEEEICWILMGFQAICCGIAFGIRYWIAGYFY